VTITSCSITDLKCEDNLLFYTVSEEKDEDCASKVLHFQRAHRIGAFNKDTIRHIVVKIVLFPDRERVQKSYKKLKGTQFPKEIVESRTYVNML